MTTWKFDFKVVTIDGMEKCLNFSLVESITSGYGQVLVFEIPVICESIEFETAVVAMVATNAILYFQKINWF